VPVHPGERKPAAIFAADIAGYSRLMARDAEGMLRRLQALRRELVNLVGPAAGVCRDDWDSAETGRSRPRMVRLRYSAPCPPPFRRS
jgi:class 3 adenylate cyclase